MIHQLKPAVKRERSTLLSTGACQQHDKTHIIHPGHTVIQVQDLKLELLSHPPYSPDLIHSDFHLFWPLKTPYVTSLLIGCYSNQSFFSYCLTGNAGGNLQNVVGATLKINVIVLYMFSLYITLYSFSSFHLNDSCAAKYVYFMETYSGSLAFHHTGIPLQYCYCSLFSDETV
jgi:hypothetical protein